MADDDIGSSLSAPPWSLKGRGYVFLYYPKRELILREPLLDEETRKRYAGGPAAVMLVDYHSSNVGPYRELLVIPGLFRFGKKRRFSISHIFVSTKESVRAGRANWGIPKELAAFDWEKRGTLESIRVRMEDRVFAEIVVRGIGPSVPVATAPIPAPLRTIFQAWKGELLSTSPKATGWARLGRLLSARVDPSTIPDFSRWNRRLAVEVGSFEMTFPPARIP